MSQHLSTVTIEPDGKRIKVDRGTTLFEAFRQARIAVETPCGGKGTCGKCLVRVVEGPKPVTASDRKFLTEEELDRGMRLACRLRVGSPGLLGLLEGGWLAERVAMRVLSLSQEVEVLPPHQCFPVRCRGGEAELDAELTLLPGWQFWHRDRVLRIGLSRDDICGDRERAREQRESLHRL